MGGNPAIHREAKTAKPAVRGSFFRKPLISEIVFSLNINEKSNVINTTISNHIVILQDIKLGKQPNINEVKEKIKDEDKAFLERTLKEQHPADSADLIENLLPENRAKLIELEGFNLEPEIFIELNESIQTEVFILLTTESIAIF